MFPYCLFYFIIDGQIKIETCLILITSLIIKVMVFR